MGVGVSSLRLRKALVIRSYNLRETDETLEEQFRKISTQNEESGEIQLNLDDVKEYLGFGVGSSGASKVDRLLGGSLTGKEINFREFVEFLESGNTPASKLEDGREEVNENEDNGSTSCSIGRQRSSSKLREKKGLPNKDNRNGVSFDTPAPGGNSNDNNNNDNPPSPPVDRTHNRDAALAFARAEADATMLGDDVETETDSSDKLSDPTECASPNPNPNTSFAKVPSLELIITGSLNNEGLQRSNSSVWRKREVVKQERTIHYTTVDDDGQLQELVETETSQREVLHMESRDTGVFAHRETTLYETKETFNDEVVNLQTGQEEYVHLKSVDDEYEYMDSSGMPPRDGQGQGEGEPVSPRSPNVPFTSEPAANKGAEGHRFNVPNMNFSNLNNDNGDENENENENQPRRQEEEEDRG